jgi:hypothetical protein
MRRYGQPSGTVVSLNTAAASLYIQHWWLAVLSWTQRMNEEAKNCVLRTIPYDFAEAYCPNGS